MTDFPAEAELCAAARNAAGARAPLRCEVIREFRRLDEIWSDWARLWQADPQAEMFQSPEWARAWWGAFGRHSTLCTIAVHAGDEIVGIVPLVKQDGVVRFLGTPEADYADILCSEEWAPEVLAAAFEALTESVGGWSECFLGHLSENSRVVRHCGSLPGRLRSRVRAIATERYQTIVAGDKPGAVFDSLLRKNHTRRRRNKLEKAGEVRFRSFESGQEAEGHLSEFFRHHVRRFAASGRQSQCANPDFCQFLRALVGDPVAAERTRFGVLELNGRPLAWYFGFELNGKFLLYQHTFDLDASDYTPGELLLWNLLRYARDGRIGEFDFGTGDELYKNRFANHSRETYTVFFEPRGLAGRMRGWKRSLQSSTHPAVRDLEQLVRKRATMRAFRSLRMWARGTVAGIRRAGKAGVLWQYGRRFTRELMQNALWSRRSIEVFAAAAFKQPGVEAGVPERVNGNRPRDLRVGVAQFGDLVDLAWERPDILLPGELGRYRKRLKQGERAYVAREDSRVVMICWASSRPASEVPGCVARSGIAPDSPVILIEECWSAPACDLACAYRLVLAGEAFRLNAGVPAYCGLDQPALPAQLEREGVHPKFRITRYGAFGRFGGESVRVHPPTSVQFPPSL